MESFVPDTAVAKAISEDGKLPLSSNMVISWYWRTLEHCNTQLFRSFHLIVPNEFIIYYEKERVLRKHCVHVEFHELDWQHYIWSPRHSQCRRNQTGRSQSIVSPMCQQCRFIVSAADTGPTELTQTNTYILAWWFLLCTDIISCPRAGVQWTCSIYPTKCYSSSSSNAPLSMLYWRSPGSILA